MAWTFNDGFETYAVGAEPYPPLSVDPALVDDTLVRFGSKSLGPGPSGTNSGATLTTTADLPITISGWTWCETRTPDPGDGGTPDITTLVLTEEPFLIGLFSTVGFVDIPDEPGYVQGTFRHDSDALAFVGSSAPVHSDPYPGPGWYQITLDITAVEGGVLCHASVHDNDGNLFWEHTDALGGTPVGGWRVGLDVPQGSAWDFPGVLAVVRQYPRDDGLGHSSAPRNYPPPKAGRNVGGYQ